VTKQSSLYFWIAASGRCPPRNDADLLGSSFFSCRSSGLLGLGSSAFLGLVARNSFFRVVAGDKAKERAAKKAEKAGEAA
jgi:hypothetical protein